MKASIAVSRRFELCIYPRRVSGTLREFSIFVTPSNFLFHDLTPTAKHCVARLQVGVCNESFQTSSTMGPGDLRHVEIQIKTVLMGVLLASVVNPQLPYFNVWVGTTGWSQGWVGALVSPSSS